jgi:predicted cobalt transporter CbtA
MKKILRVTSLGLIAASAAPLLAFADGGINTDQLSQYSNSFIQTVNTVLVPVLVAIAFIVFLYGVARYFIIGGANEGDREIGRQYILWGLIGFVVIISVWGIVNIIINTFGLTNTGNNPKPPTFTTTGTNGQ